MRQCIAAQGGLQHPLGVGRLGRAQQEPADKTDPDAVQDVTTEDLQEAPEDEEVGDDLARERGDACGFLQAAGDLPDDGAQHPPAGEWVPLSGNSSRLQMAPMSRLVSGPTKE
jgi:hypothetical protein